uniref:Recombination protein RecR n=1 Tax=Anthurium amnicola TaxID=1678845 RepID=A0A1D1ZCI4_9ARAE
MAADSNMGFHRRTAPSSLCNHHMVSFQSRAVGSSAMMIPEDMDGFVGANSTAGMILAGNPGGINDPAVLIPRGNNARGLHHDPVTELKHDTELAVEWSLEEQWLLDTGLVMYANEPNIMKYIKIAAMLQNKTVRDVALRCRWITKKESGKRLKQECYIEKKMKDKKEKQVDCSLRATVTSNQVPITGACSVIMHFTDSRNVESCEVPFIDRVIQCLLEENAELLSHIKVNLNTSKLHDNVGLFFCVKNNITSIMNRMSEMPGIMSQMPPLTVSVNEELCQGYSAVCTQGGVHLKRGARC